MIEKSEMKKSVLFLFALHSRFPQWLYKLNHVLERATDMTCQEQEKVSSFSIFYLSKINDSLWQPFTKWRTVKSILSMVTNYPPPWNLNTQTTETQHCFLPVIYEPNYTPFDDICSLFNNL